jgi:hypothetical protein
MNRIEVKSEEQETDKQPSRKGQERYICNGESQTPKGYFRLAKLWRAVALPN